MVFVTKTKQKKKTNAATLWLDRKSYLNHKQSGMYVKTFSYNLEGNPSVKKIITEENPSLKKIVTEENPSLMNILLICIKPPC